MIRRERSTFIKKATVLALILTLLASSKVLSGDYITDAAAVLQQTPVYVAPGTERTDNETAGILQARLLSDDNIVLVMLPASAETELGVNIFTIADRLSDELGDQRIIGLSVGRKLVGYAPSLPVNVASDLMRRAESVSNDSVTALGTFAQNMHRWQVDHPQPVKPAPFKQPASGESQIPPAWLVPLALALAPVGWVIRRRMKRNERERTHFRAPDQVSDLLTRIAEKRRQLADLEFQQVLFQMCLDIEIYFKSYSKDKTRDALDFTNRLTEVSDVLSKYVEIQDNRRYYREPDNELSKGKESITGFSQYLLDSIQNGRQADLIDYTVNTKILEAQRYRR